MSFEQTVDSLTISEIKTHSCSFIIKVKDFSNETIDKSGKAAHVVEESVSDGEVRDTYSLIFFANGMTSDDKGYVTVEFWIEKPYIVSFYENFELSCVFSLVDASESRRFPQSYVIDSHSYLSSENDPFVSIIVDRLLKRDFLLSDKDDLLPGDCFSLHIEFEIRAMINYGPHDQAFVENVMGHSFEFKETVDGMNDFLHLDSELAKRLAQVSSYFQRMLETPMVERKTRYVKIAKGEYSSLKDIYKILMGAKQITFDSINDICQMYITADKYDIPIAVESCRNLLTSFLGVEDDPCTDEDVEGAEDVEEKIPSLLELAETYNDVRLKGNIESFLKNNREDWDFDRCTEKRLQKNRETEWKFDRRIYYFTSFLTFTKNTKEKPAVNAYK